MTDSTDAAVLTALISAAADNAAAIRTLAQAWLDLSADAEPASAAVPVDGERRFAGGRGLAALIPQDSAVASRIG